MIGKGRNKGDFREVVSPRTQVVLGITTSSGGSQYWQVMDGTAVDSRMIIHREFGRFADALKFALSLN